MILFHIINVYTILFHIINLYTILFHIISGKKPENTEIYLLLFLWWESDGLFRQLRWFKKVQNRSSSIVAYILNIYLNTHFPELLMREGEEVQARGVGAGFSNQPHLYLKTSTFTFTMLYRYSQIHFSRSASQLSDVWYFLTMNAENEWNEQVMCRWFTSSITFCK